MARKFVAALVGLAGLALALAPASFAAPKQIQWTDNLEKGLAQAKKENKPALIDFYADWCGWCERLDKDTYTDPKVIELSKRFVMIKVNTEGERRATIKYGVRSLPTIVITDASAREIGRVTGYRPASSFLNEMQVALRQTRASR
jgi:thiol:disulfide interchange protein